MGLDVELFDQVLMGVSYGGDQIIGYGKPNFNPRVEFHGKYRVLEELGPAPSVCIGFESQGYAGYFKEQSRYRIKSKGFYGVAGKTFPVLQGLYAQGGVNFSLETEDGENEPNVFMGIEQAVSPELSVRTEFDLALNDNDRGNGMGTRLSIWRTAGQNRRVQSVTAEQVAGSVVKITVEARLAAGDSRQGNIYTVYGNGEILVNCSVDAAEGLPNMPRFGMQMEIPKEFENVRWYGRGPHENYWDRKTGAGLGIYSGTVDQLIHNYVRPQENGNRSDVRWAAFLNEEGMGLLITGVPSFDFSLWPWEMESLEETRHGKKRHLFELERSRSLTLNIDYKQMGVGGDTSWGARTHREYRLEEKSYSYRFRMRPGTRSDVMETGKIR